MIINIYDKNNLQVIAHPVATSLEDFKDSPVLFYPDWDSTRHVCSNTEFQNPILAAGTIREMTKEELYAVGKYTLADNELIENNKIKTVELSECEYVENNTIKLNREKRIEQIKNELYELRLAYDVAPFEFEVGGVKYLQNNRSIDQSNLTRIVVMCQAMKKTEFENWKFYTKDNTEKYVNLTLQDMMKMANIMQLHTTKAMTTETLLSHNLENLTDAELKEYDAKDRYEKAYKNM
ncbi:hypothetical protein [Leptotrichia sp. oral taxon 223]|uniref:DUF4376 domain-containing protein n=1 Tax=Leptotrichia sp. oral taxon 223 TaxID=712363 RepID=UPI0015B822BE|nr:hypothetical protein [Leptotrichia sp. oral taxon 223]NWO20134.1 hypothetical protein [Leptotrichia sp. oral taxon 223]